MGEVVDEGLHADPQLDDGASAEEAAEASLLDEEAGSGEKQEVA